MEVSLAGVATTLDQATDSTLVVYMTNRVKRSFWLWLVVFIAVGFGVLTIKSGGAVLFIDGAARLAAGDYVGFVLWFNFLAGFAYIAAGLGLWFHKKWATGLAVMIALATLLVFAAFGIHILVGGNYEVRTVVAMSLRSTIWIGIALVSYFLLGRRTAA